MLRERRSGDLVSPVGLGSLSPVGLPPGGLPLGLSRPGYPSPVITGPSRWVYPRTFFSVYPPVLRLRVVPLVFPLPCAGLSAAFFRLLDFCVVPVLPDLAGGLPGGSGDFPVEVLASFWLVRLAVVLALAVLPLVLVDLFPLGACPAVVLLAVPEVFRVAVRDVLALTLPLLAKLPAPVPDFRELPVLPPAVLAFGVLALVPAVVPDVLPVLVLAVMVWRARFPFCAGCRRLSFSRRLSSKPPAVLEPQALLWRETPATCLCWRSSQNWLLPVPPAICSSWMRPPCGMFCVQLYQGWLISLAWLALWPSLPGWRWLSARSPPSPSALIG